MSPNEDQVPWVQRRTHVSWVLRPYPSLLDHVSGSNSLESVVQAQFSFLSRPCPTLLGRASKPKSHGSGHRPNSLGSCAIPISIGSCVQIHFYWVMCLGSNLLGHTSRPKSLGLGVQTQLFWILCLDLTELDTSIGRTQ
jgi:hypothetical protein